ncbi:hypothetical protein ACFPOI_00420 [Nonomuraea angiospora]|uniref:Outer membrane channel protein CpnT-like N-terminal domain-containing protein n=1 Tax=Nonomuraea angiospora TaxID=46172 RepID=A0ABR9M1U4_9ACTN|nr:hypothetical protein [Nonomuraea angiospora]MBE1586867.1 hypothetical protein [Nonomuraea angiospora]
MPWPDEDEQALREVAAAYRAFADTLDKHAVPTMTAGVVTAAAAGDGDDVAAMRAYTADYHHEGGHLTTLASLSRLLADGHELVATVVEHLKVFLAASAAYVVAAVAAAAVAGGAAMVAAYRQVAERRVVVQRAVAAFRRTLERLFGRTLAQKVRDRLRPLLEARPPTAAARRGRSPVAPNATVRQLKDLICPDLDRSALSRGKTDHYARLPDHKLLEAVFKPGEDMYITVRGRVVLDGNHRTEALLRRAYLSDRHPEDTSITWDTPIHIRRLDDDA